MITHEQLDKWQESGMVGEQMTNHLLIDIHNSINYLASRINKYISVQEKILEELRKK